MPSVVVNDDGSVSVTVVLFENFEVTDDFPAGGDIDSPYGSGVIVFRSPVSVTGGPLNITTDSHGSSRSNFVIIDADVWLPSSHIDLFGDGDVIRVRESLSLDGVGHHLGGELSLGGFGTLLRNYGEVEANIIRLSLPGGDAVTSWSENSGPRVLENHGLIEARVLLGADLVDNEVRNFGTITGTIRQEPPSNLSAVIEYLTDNDPADPRLINYGHVEGDVFDVLVENHGTITGTVRTYGEFEGSGGRFEGDIFHTGEVARIDLRGAEVTGDVIAGGELYLHNALIPNAVNGLDGDDTIRARGADVGEIHGQGGNDLIDVRGATVKGIHGGDGDDVIDARGATELRWVDGGGGDDLYRVEEGVRVLEDEDGGTDTVELWSGFLWLNENLENVRLRGEAETVIGNSQNNRMLGNGLDNGLNGHSGDDRLYGFGGDDLLSDMDGVDNLWGGSGSDRFLLYRDGDWDAIKDFEVNIDLINVSMWAANTFEDLDISTLRAGKVVVRSGDERLLIQDREGLMVADDLNADQFEFTLALT